MDSKQRAQEVRVAMKEIISKLMFPNEAQEGENEEAFWFAGALLFPEHDDLQVTYEVSLDFKCDAIQAFVFYHQPVSTNKIQEVDELIHNLNLWPGIGHLFRNPRSNKLAYTVGIIVRDLEFDKADFERVIDTLIKTGGEFLNFLRQQLQGNGDPNISLKRFI